MVRPLIIKERSAQGMSRVASGKGSSALRQSMALANGQNETVRKTHQSRRKVQFHQDDFIE
jgi:hypothetical protein